MRPSRRPCLIASLALLALSLPSGKAHADTLTITSTPSGASVEIDGFAAGTTPYKVNYPGGYFHKTHSVFGARLEHSMTVRISLPGYQSQKITLTEGPFEWVAVTGRHHGSYFLLKSAHFDVKLDPIPFGEQSSNDPVAGEGPMPPAAAAAFRADAHDSPETTGRIAISSDPAGAEIYVDGQFVGQTPSNIPMSGGPHRIELKSRGTQTWQRDLTVLKDSQLTIHAVLDPAP